MSAALQTVSLPPLKLLSVVIPARDEEGCVASTVEHLHLELRLRGVPHEIVVVDDGSADRTWQILMELKASNPALNPCQNPGPHGFSEILYAFTSASQNNGSAFGGLSANSLFYNLTTAFCMFVGRFGVAILTLALAGSLVEKKIIPAGEGTLSGHRPLFIIWLVFVVIIIGVLSFLPALALGPIVEHLLLGGGA